VAKNSAKDLSQKLSLVLKAQCDLNLTKGISQINSMFLEFQFLIRKIAMSESEEQANASLLSASQLDEVAALSDNTNCQSIGSSGKMKKSHMRNRWK
jgi:hypothetical protein